MHPVGPLNSKVYWIRRVSIVVLAVAVLVGMVWFLASRTSRSSANQEQPAAVVNSSVPPTLTGVLAASSGATTSTVPPSPAPTVAPTAPAPTAAVTAPTSADPAAAAAAESAAQAAAALAASGTITPPPPDPAAQAAAAQAAADAAAAAAAAQAAADAAAQAAAAVPPAPAPVPPSYDADGKLICPDTAIAVLATSTAPSFPVGSNPILGMTITNSGTETCQRDVSGTLQTFTVLAADGARVWSTSDCFPGEGTEVRELTPGQTLKYTVKWSGTTSAPGCAGERAPIPAGDYSVVAQLGGLVSPPAAFSMTG